MAELGMREVDLQFDYDAARVVYTREVDFYLKFLENARKISVFRKFNHLAKLKTLNDDQKQCMQILKRAVDEILKGTHVIASVTGSAGVGKSLMLSALCVQLDVHKLDYIVCAYTGSSAAHFNAHTLFSMLGIYNCHLKTADMIHTPIHKSTRARLRNTQVIVLEEAFLCGARTFALLLKRLAVIKGSKDVPCVSVFTFGDDLQLAPISDFLLNSEIKPYHDNLTKEGLKLYQSAQFKYELTQNVRQQSDIIFQGILTRIRNREITEDDIKKLETRLEKNLSVTEREVFKNVVHLFATNKECRAYLYSMLVESDLKVKRIEPIFSDHCNDCKKNYQEIYIACGLKVTLTRNFIVAKGLTNGSDGYVKHIYYDKDNLTTPVFITVSFLNYSGPKLFDESVPVPPIEDRFFCVHQKKFIKVRYFPLQAALVKTVHKAQSSSYEHVVIDFSYFNYYDRRLYTALSRCVKLNNILIKCNKPLRFYFKRP